MYRTALLIVDRLQPVAIRIEESKPFGPFAPLYPLQPHSPALQKMVSFFEVLGKKDGLIPRCLARGEFLAWL